MGIRPLPKPSERPKAAVAASIVGLRQGQRVSVLPSRHNSSLMQSHSGMKEAVSVFRQRCSPIQAACGQDHICLPLRHFCLPRAYDCGEEYTHTLACSCCGLTSASHSLAFSTHSIITLCSEVQATHTSFRDAWTSPHFGKLRFAVSLFAMIGVYTLRKYQTSYATLYRYSR